MERSIENIWKQGFMEEVLEAPARINNLYNQKSLLIIGKLTTTMKWDNLSLIPMAIAALVFLSMSGKIWVGIYAMAALSALFAVNRRHIKKLLAIEKQSDCYSYLTGVRAAIKQTIKFYNRLLAIGAPIALSLGVWLYLYGEQPLELILVLIGVISVCMPLISIFVYHISVKIVYGRMLKRLNETIEEMEKLKG